MKQIGFAVIAIVLFASVSPSLAFEDAQLAVSAAQYEQTIRDRHPQVDTGFEHSQALRRALRYAEQQLWPEAIAAYERIIAAGSADSDVWLWLGEAWQGDAKKRNQSRYRQAALMAAYQAYVTAQIDTAKARALVLLGELYQAARQPKSAIAVWKEALGLSENPSLVERYRKLAAAHAFRVTQVQVESNSAVPKVCLRFSEPLQQDPRLHYEDYVRIQPSITAVVSAQDRRLCIEGVQHSYEYQLTLRPGIAAKSGEQITQALTFTAAVGDREPTLGFRGSAYILPKNGTQGVPLTSVNVSKARLQVLRINDRSLIRELSDKQLFKILDGYSSRRIRDRKGELVWQGELEIRVERNQEVTTAIPMADILPHTEAGIYILTADDAAQQPERWRDLATQWLVVSDLGIHTLRGDDGLHVFVRGLNDAQVRTGIQLKLYARNNSELGQLSTDVQGYARFDPGLLRGRGGRQPTALMAFTDGGDFNFIDLSRPGFDLSDRGVAGRKTPGPIDAFLYSDRGVYRPGETVRLSALLRDAQGHALAEVLPLTLRLIRPDQVVANQWVLNDSAVGGYTLDVALADNARRGVWQVRAYTDPGAAPVGQYRFRIDDFVPQRLKLKLDSDAQQLFPGESIQVAVNGRFLYGAPAAGLNTEAELTLREDPDPYPDYPGFQFGLAQQRWDAQRYPLTLSDTDTNGQTQLAVKLDERPDTSRALKAIVQVSLFEPGGRPVTEVLGWPYRTQPYAIGIKSNFDAELQIGQAANFAVIAVDADGEPLSISGLRYELFREEYDYFWYFRDNRWDYKRIIRDSAAITSRNIDLTAEQPLQLDQAGLDWGRYRVEIYDPRNGVASSVRFRVGWFVEPGSADTPDRLQLTLDKDHYRAGETARVFVKAPFAGEVLLTVADHQLRSQHSFNLPQGGTTIELPVSIDWDPGVYLLASAFRPATNTNARGPGRAIGVAWLGFDPQPRQLQVTIDAPTEVRPRQTVQLPISIDNAIPGEPVALTLAAVDEGILQLTDFSSPNAVDYYLGKRRLGMDLRDVYGKLIEPEGWIGRLRSGAGAAGKNLDGTGVRTVKTVALFHGPLTVGSDGQVTVALTLPDFNGELRLMVVAWDRHRLGQAQTSLLVRDPIVARAYLPRFLAIGDAGQLTLNVHNLSAPAGDYQMALFAAGAVALEQAVPFTFSVVQNSQDQHRRAYTLRGVHAGVGYIALQIDGPDGFNLRREWGIGVRPAQTYVSERRNQRLLPGRSLQLDSHVLDDYLVGTGRVQLSLAGRPDLNVPALLKQLDRYPYGCLEQTTSRALPLLYFDAVTRNWLDGDASDTAALRERIQQAIQRIFAMQRFSGGFGLWHEDSPVEHWLSAYALDFLVRAQEAGYWVSEPAYQRGLDWLKQQLNRLQYKPEQLAFRAYALYVLARADQAPLGELRYLHDQYRLKLPSRLAKAQLGAALARYGDQERATVALQLALQDQQAPALRDYGSALRDQAAVTALLGETNLLGDQLAAQAQRLADALDLRRYTSTQEQAWLLLAAHALGQQPREALQFSINQQHIEQDRHYYFSPDIDELAEGLTLTNRGAQALWANLDSSGVPAAPQPPTQAGFAISRRYYNRSGEPIETASGIQQNDVLVVVISGEALTEQNHQALIVDLLPAGLEIENANLGHGQSTADLKWLPKLSQALHTELRDDRFVAALDLSAKQRRFALAYVVRAVTPGDYAAPAVFVEDMYKPWLHGRGTLNRLAIR